MTDYVQERLELGVDFGAVGGPRFNTTVVILGNASERRNINWPTSRGEWNAGNRVANNEEISYLLDFFKRRRGRAVGFRWKDWSDYRSVNRVMAVADDTSTLYQVRKTYGSSDAEVYRRNVHRIVDGTFTLNINGGAELSPGTSPFSSLDADNGVVTFEAALNPGDIVRATYEFDVPVRFDVDQIDLEFNAYDQESDEALFTVSSIPIIEIPPDVLDGVTVA